MVQRECKDIYICRCLGGLLYHYIAKKLNCFIRLYNLYLINMILPSTPIVEHIQRFLSLNSYLIHALTL